MSEIRRRAMASVLVLAILWSVTMTCIALRRRAVQALPAQSESLTAEAEDPLTRFRAERSQLRAKERGELNDLIHGGSEDPEIVAEAQRRLLALSECEAAELEIEGILRARGFEAVLAVVRANAASILVRGGALSQRENAVILDLVLRQTGITGGNVKIIPVK